MFDSKCVVAEVQADKLAPPVLQVQYKGARIVQPIPGNIEQCQRRHLSLSTEYPYLALYSVKPYTRYQQGTHRWQHAGNGVAADIIDMVATDVQRSKIIVVSEAAPQLLDQRRAETISRHLESSKVITSNFAYLSKIQALE